MFNLKNQLQMTTTITDIPTVVKKYYGQEELRILLNAEIRPNTNGVNNTLDVHFIIPDRFRESFDSLCFHLQDRSTDWFQTSCRNWAVVPLGEIDKSTGRTILYIKEF